MASLRSYLGDRRAGLRFQIAGRLWAALDVRSEAVVRNISSTGALLEARLSQDVRATRAASITLPGGPELTVQIRHLTPMTEIPADDRCLVGVEFLRITSEERRAIETFIQTRT